MKVLRIEKEVVTSFLVAVVQSFELIAPIKTDLVRFETIKDPGKAQLHFEKNAYFPLKEFFFKKQDVVFQFDGSSVTVPAYPEPKRVFFGVRKCDLNAIHHQDKVFITDAGDPSYIAARKNSYLIGYQCRTAPSAACFCGTLRLIDFHDLMFYDTYDSYFLVEVGSEKGEHLATKFSSFFSPAQRQVTQEEKHIIGADRLLTDDLSKMYDHPLWQRDVNNSLSCTACTSLCPRVIVLASRMK